MLLRTAVLSIILAQAPEPRGTGRHAILVNSAEPLLKLTADSYDMSCILSSAGLEPALAEDFALVADVHHVLVEHVEGHVLVWLAADNPSRQVRERIFQKQLDLIEGFPEVEFDFNVINSPDVDPRGLSSNAKVIYSRGAEIAD